MTTLVVAEHDNHSIHVSTLSAVNAARLVDSEIHLLIIGHTLDSIARQAVQIDSVSEVLVADAAHLEVPLAEDVEAIVVSISSNYSHVMLPATTAGKNFAPRIAAKLDVAQISEITAVITPNTFERPIYAGSAIATVQTSDSKVVATVRMTAFEPVPAVGGQALLRRLEELPGFALSRFVKRDIARHERPDLGAARIVVSGGRGLGSQENFEKILAPLADKLEAALGASRAAVDSGFVSNEYQVGQTGKIVAPELYVAIGISGAIQHLAGMKDSKLIVAINNDSEAPIFSVADYGVVGDLFAEVPKLVDALE